MCPSKNKQVLEKEMLKAVRGRAWGVGGERIKAKAYIYVIPSLLLISVQGGRGGGGI